MLQTNGKFTRADKRTSIDRTHQIENFDLTAMKSIIIAVFFAIVLTAVEATNAAGKEYLAKKATEEGVVTLPSGLLYKVVKTSDSKKSPTANVRWPHFDIYPYSCC